MYVYVTTGAELFNSQAEWTHPVLSQSSDLEGCAECISGQVYYLAHTWLQTSNKLSYIMQHIQNLLYDNKISYQIKKLIFTCVSYLIH